jgi:hypothetical protein
MRAIFLSVLLALLLVSGLLLSLPDSTFAQSQSTDLTFPGEENWNSQIGSLNLTRTVHAVAFDQNYLYLGEGYGEGDKHIRRWDGTQWQSIAGNVDGAVLAVLPSHDGKLYAGGYFTRTGTCNPCKRMAQWDGSKWSALGDGLGNLSDEVLALAQDSAETLYAGGTFGVATWNGSRWDLDSSTTDDWIYALAVDQHDRLFAGGYTFPDGGDPFPSLRMKVNSTWSNLGTAFEHDIPNGISALAFYPPQVLTPTIGGSIQSPANYLASWKNGWQSIGTPDKAVLALAEDTCGGLYVGGSFRNINNQPNRFLAYYDGNNWHSLGDTFTTDSQSVEDLAFYHGYLAVGGVFTQTLSGQNRHNIALWTGRDCATISASGTYTLYNWREPVVIKVGEQGTLARIRVQRFNKDHPGIDQTTTPNLKNGVYWQIEGLDENDQPASGISYTLTLPAVGFIPDAKDKICHYLGNAKWDCAASSYDPEEKTISRAGLTAFSEFTVGNDVGPTVVGLQSLRTRQPEISLLAFVLILLSMVGLVYLQKKKL